MVYRYVCEPCREALGLPADRPHLNRIRREASKPSPEVFRRDPSGKPFIVGRQRADGVFEGTNSLCACACQSNGHDPYRCNGRNQFKIGGRPGSGFVDQLAERLGREPIPHLINDEFVACQVLVVRLLAWWYASSEEECAAIEADIERWRYADQVKELQDIVRAERPDLMACEPYSSLKANLIDLARFRNKIEHSYPLNGDFFTRVKRAKGVDELIHITDVELAEYLDKAMALRSQLSFMPMYFDPAVRAEALARQGKAA